MKNKAAFLYLAFTAEILLVFYLRNKAGFILSPLLLMVAGLFLCVFPVILHRRYYLKQVVPVNMQSKATDKLYTWVWFAVLAVGYLIASYFVFRTYKPDISQSDIIPFIERIMVQRFVSGESVYAPSIGLDNYPYFTPNYLPMHWLPFVASYILKIDHRWIPVCIFLLASAYFVRLNFKSNSSRIAMLVHVSLPFVVVYSIYFKQAIDAAHTVEIMIAGYYLFLACSIFSTHRIVRALGMLFPLMSRYSLATWLPGYFYGMWVRNTKIALVTGLLLAALVAVVFVIPFVLPEPQLLTTFNDVYIGCAVGEWDGQSWQKPGDRPFQLFQGMGFASWYYEFYPGTIMQKVLALKNTLLIVAMFSALLPMLLYKKITSIVSPDLYTLLSLKFCLTLFYAFIIVPYVYLFWVPLMISVVILIRVKAAADN